MQQARKLRRGDKVAIVSLSSGMLGEEYCSHNIEIGVRRLREYGLEPVFMPNALKGVEYLKNHPEARAADLKSAFLDDTIAGIICAIGGDDTYRLLPYLMERQGICECSADTSETVYRFFRYNSESSHVLSVRVIYLLWSKLYL